MVSASSSRASSRKVKISSSREPSVSSVRAAAVWVVAVSWDSASSARVIAVLPEWWSWSGSWLRRLPSPGPAGAAQRPGVHRPGRRGGRGAVGIGAGRPVGTVAGELAVDRGPDGLGLAVVVGSSALVMRLVPDRRVVPRLTGLVAGALAPTGHEDQQRQQHED